MHENAVNKAVHTTLGIYALTIQSYQTLLVGNNGICPGGTLKFYKIATEKEATAE